MLIYSDLKLQASDSGLIRQEKEVIIIFILVWLRE